MKLKFSDLKVGDTVYCVYDKNYNNNDDNYDLTIIKAKVISNSFERREIVSSSYYDNDVIICNERNMIIKPEKFDKEYKRYYNKFYDEKAQMTITAEIYSNNPSLEIFVSKEDAKDYAMAFMNKILLRNIQNINKLKTYNEQIEKTLNDLDSYE